MKKIKQNYYNKTNVWGQDCGGFHLKGYNSRFPLNQREPEPSRIQCLHSL